MLNESLISLGGAVKAIKTEGDLLTVGGYLVTFGDDKAKDFDGDYFTAKTYFGAHNGDGVDVLFHHGLPLPVKSADPVLAAKVNKLADQVLSTVKTKVDEVGLFAETVLNMANEYEKVVGEAAIAGKIGWSSGAIAHAVRRKDGVKNGEVERWIIGEASLTPTPCDVRNYGTVLPLKAFIASEEVSDGKPVEVKSEYLGKYVESSALESVISSLSSSLRYGVFWDILYRISEDDSTWEAERPVLVGALTEFQTIILNVADGLMKGSDAAAIETAFKALSAAKSNPNFNTDDLLAGLTVKQTLDVVLAANKAYPDRLNAIKAKREGENRNFYTEGKRLDIDAALKSLDETKASLVTLLPSPDESFTSPTESPLGSEIKALDVDALISLHENASRLASV